MKNNHDYDSTENKINLDFDWNSEYGDGDIPDIDKNSKDSDSARNKSSQNKSK